MSDAPLRTTPLHDRHLAAGAKMAPFGGWDMPIQYTGILDEHRAVREAAGVFDVSHMGEFRVRGPGALALVQRLVTNDVTKLSDGQAQYAVLCDEDGGAVDDLLVYRLADDDVLLVVNAANIEGDWAHVSAEAEVAGLDASLENESDDWALLALQGPQAFDVFETATGLDVSDIPYYHFRPMERGAVFGAERAIVSHTGYTGERGLELYLAPAAAGRAWDALVEAGATPAGLGARDTLRLEAGYCLYGHELDRDTTPLEAGLGWVVKPDAADFVGRDALVQQKTDGVPRKLVGLMVEGRGIPRAGYPIVDGDGEAIGVVTSGSQSPTLGKGVALGFVPNDATYTAPGTELGISIRNRVLPAVVTKPPFHKS
jgi:aminomethyltransferase